MELQSDVVPKVLGLKIKFISNTPIRLLLPLYIYIKLSMIVITALSIQFSSNGVRLVLLKVNNLHLIITQPGTNGVMSHRVTY